MTSHDYDAHCDTLEMEATQYHEDLLAEQEQHEAKAAHESALRKEGAHEALTELRQLLCLCAIDDRLQDEFFGLKWSIDAIDRRLADLAEVKGGAL